MELYACRAATAEQFESLVFFLDVQEHTNPRFKQARAMPDPVAAVHRRFTHQELPSRVFLNSVPKCGTMLLRNILAMFIPWEEIYWTFITNNNLPQHQKAIQSPHYKFFTGHLDYTPETSILMRDFTLILNIRDPYGYVLSNARFFYSQPKYKDSLLARYIQDHGVTFDDVVPLVINGFCFHGEVVPNVVEVYVNKAMNWFRTAGKVVSYEELCRHIQNLSTSEAKTYFQDILDLLQIEQHLHSACVSPNVHAVDRHGDSWLEPLGRFG